MNGHLADAIVIYQQGRPAWFSRRNWIKFSLRLRTLKEQDVLVERGEAVSV